MVGMSSERGSESQLNCFIIAPQGSLSDLLQQQLNQEGVLCLRLDLSNPPWLPSVQVTSLIDRADFIAAVIDGSPSPNLYFELGLAMGKGKPLLLFSDNSKVTSALASATTVLTSAIRNDSWRDLRRAFLRTLQPTSPGTKRKSSKNANVRRRWRELSSEFETLRTGATDRVGRQFERLVEKAFQLADFPISQSPTPDFGADFALASPKLLRSIGLPILIEVKNNSREPIQQKAIDRLDDLIAEGRGGAALLTTTVPPLPAVNLYLRRPIVIVPFDELLGWLEQGSFEDEFLLTVDAFWEKPK